MEGESNKLSRNFFLVKLYCVVMITSQDKIEFLSYEIQRLDDLIERITPYVDFIVEGKQTNRSILDDAMLKKQVYQDLLSDLQ